MKPTRHDPRNGTRGLRVVGPRLYLWDPDAREALRLAAELGVRRGRAPLSARRRAPTRAPLLP